jgi:hypothetical protein
MLADIGERHSYHQALGRWGQRHGEVALHVAHMLPHVATIQPYRLRRTFSMVRAGVQGISVSGEQVCGGEKDQHI